MSHDIYICSVYVPPQNSSRELRTNIDHFECLQEKIYKFGTLGKILLCGDFNARTGTGSAILRVCESASCELRVCESASCESASCESASLRVASLRVASLRACESASCESASCESASCESASLRVASLRVASLRVASLRVASLRVASLRVASLRVYGGDLLPRKRSLKCNFVCFDELILYFIL